MQSLRVPQLPSRPRKGQIYTIETKNVSYYTHGIYKYPCKFIPQIPGWALDNLLDLENGNSQTIYDPFVGSGTTLVEATLRSHKSIGSEIDPLGRLITRVKTQSYPAADLIEMAVDLEKLISPRMSKETKIKPNMPGLDHWFSKDVIDSLSILLSRINTLDNSKSRDLYLVVFASIIKKVSRADDSSPKPYVSSRFTKPELDAFTIFEKKAVSVLRDIEKHQCKSTGKLIALGEDARKLRRKGNSIDLAITSPPYINAFDYVRSLKLENYWLGLVDDKSITLLRKSSIGTESVGLREHELPHYFPKKLLSALDQIKPVDKRRYAIVASYFEDMKENMEDVHRLLRPNARYVLVVANSQIRGIQVETSQILIDIAKKIGFSLENYFGYTIENRYLRIPRQGRGGYMKVDWVIVLKKGSN